MTEDAYFKLLAEALSRAYAPYSRFAVGAVVRGESGRLYLGANVENAAYPQGWCAEASALAAMVMAGEIRLTEVAVMAERGRVCTPCGGCRQKLKEFAVPDTLVLLYSPEGLQESFALEELLPHSFSGAHLS
jgi:cytidine deaminase